MIRPRWALPRILLLAIVATALSACTRTSFFLANAPAYLGAYRHVADVSYGQDPRLKLDVYAPQKAATSTAPVTRPVVVFFYGGSWTDGERSNYRFVGAALATRGYVAVLPDYRLFPAVRFPRFVEDSALAVAWAQSHAQEFGGDPDRIVLMGHSAGAHM